MEIKKCPNCGSNLQHSYSSNHYYCVYCDSIAYDGAEDKLDTDSLMHCIVNIGNLLNLSEYDRASVVCNKALLEYPLSYELWFLSAKIKAKNFTDYKNKSHEQDIVNAMTNANNAEKEKIMNIYDRFLKLVALSEKQEHEYRAKIEKRVKYITVSIILSIFITIAIAVIITLTI